MECLSPVPKSKWKSFGVLCVSFDFLTAPLRLRAKTDEASLSPDTNFSGRAGKEGGRMFGVEMSAMKMVATDTWFEYSGSAPVAAGLHAPFVFRQKPWRRGSCGCEQI